MRELKEETNRMRQEVLEDNKRMRQELLTAIRNEIGPMTNRSSETDPLYDTIDDDGNVVTEPPRSREDRATFSAAGGSVNLRSGGNRQEANGRKVTKKDIFFIGLHVLHFIITVCVGILAAKALMGAEVTTTLRFWYNIWYF